MAGFGREAFQGEGREVSRRREARGVDCFTHGAGDDSEKKAFGRVDHFEHP